MGFDRDDRWPAFVLPKPDELLSSWLLRNSHAHQIKAHTFCKIVWPHLAFWNRDIDRMAVPDVWQMMARKVGVSPERSYQTTLAAYEGRLFKKAVSRGNSFWVLALGIYHRTHTRRGIQFCPSCLCRDALQPYYRRWWRLALAVGCPACGCELLDACPFCERPITFHRSEIGHKNELAAYPLNHCSNCYANLASLVTPAIPAVMLHCLREWHHRLNAPVEVGATQDYFAVLHQLMALLASKKPSLVRFQQMVADEAGMAFEPPAGGYKNRLETMPLADRLRLTAQIAWLLEPWPTRLLEVITRSGTRLSSILSEPEHLPQSFINLISSLRNA